MCGLSRPPIEKLSAAQAFKALLQQYRHLMLGEKIKNFFLSKLQFFENLTISWLLYSSKLEKKFYSQICIMAPQGQSRPLSRPPISRGKKLRPVQWKVAVATATWQYCRPGAHSLEIPACRWVVYILPECDIQRALWLFDPVQAYTVQAGISIKKVF